MSSFKFAEKLNYNPPFRFEEDIVEEGFYDGLIDYQKLANKIKKIKSFDFNYKDFISKKTFTPDVYPTGGSSGPRPILQDNPLTIPFEDGSGTRELKLSAKLNKINDRVSTIKGKVFFSFRLVPEKYTHYVKKIRYENINENAIEITAKSYEDYLALGEYINLVDNFGVQSLIKEEFNKAFRNVSSNSELKWLYENAPNFVLLQREDSKLLKDLQTLIIYDKESWFKDASSAILNLIIGFDEVKLVYDYFNNNPEKVITIYDVLDTESQNQFCIILNALCYAFVKKEDYKAAAFTIGNDYTLNSNIFIGGNQKEILLEHSSIYRRTVIVDQRDSFGGLGGKVEKTVGIPIPIKQQTKFHPLDIVTMVDQSTGEERYVCALNVKLLSDQAEWEFVVDAIVIVASVIAILVSAGTLAAGATGVTALIAVAEIAIGSIDIYTIINRAKLEKTEEGKWFVDNWDKLNAAVGLLSIGGALKKGVLKHGPKLLGRIKNVSTQGKQLKEFIRKLLSTIQVEFYFSYYKGIVSGIQKNTIVDISELVGSLFAKKMARFGVGIFVPLDFKKGDVFGITYDAELILEGSSKDIKASLKKAFPFGVNDFKTINKNLDDLVELAKKVKLRRAAFTKWRDKFDVNFFNHLSGDVAIEKIILFFREIFFIVPRGQGGHWLNKFLIVDRIIFPPGVMKVKNLPIDIPFKAKVIIKSLKGGKFPKSAISSIFPRNWSKLRVQEEIAYVYDKAIKNRNLIIIEPSDLNFGKIEAECTAGFKIIIEIDVNYNIINAYPKI